MTPPRAHRTTGSAAHVGGFNPIVLAHADFARADFAHADFAHAGGSPALARDIVPLSVVADRNGTSP